MSILSFISPAVVQPEIVDVEIPKDDGGVIRRGLMVIGKVVQNLANNIFFGKEPHMTVLNAFLHANVGRVTRYLTDVNVCSFLLPFGPARAHAADQKYPIAMMDDETDEWLGTTVDDTDAIVLHRFFVGQYDKIGKELLSQGKSSSDDDSALEGKQAWDAVCAAILRVGPALEIPQLSSTPRADHQGYIDLMKRYSHRNSDAMRELFVETSMPEVSTLSTSEALTLRLWLDGRTSRQFLSFASAISTSRHWTSNSLCSIFSRSVYSIILGLLLKNVSDS